MGTALDDPRYSFTIRTPEAEARARRRSRIKRAAIAASLLAAMCVPGAVDTVVPHDCAHVWVC